MVNNPITGRRYKCVTTNHNSCITLMNNFIGETGIATNHGGYYPEYCSITFDDPGAQQLSKTRLTFYWHKSDLEEVT